MEWTPERIKAMRDRLGLSQPAFAEALGFTRAASVSDLETGRSAATGPTARILDAIAEHGPRVGTGAGGDLPTQLDAVASRIAAIAQAMRNGTGEG